MELIIAGCCALLFCVCFVVGFIVCDAIQEKKFCDRQSFMDKINRL